MDSSTPSNADRHAEPALARRLGLFDATMIVMGGIIGSGIFMNPSIVARHVTTPFLILLVWFLGGLVALAAAFIWAELAALRPEVGGQYAYLRDAFHPLLAFLYGWGLLLVIQTGGMAAVAVTFARYFRELTGLQASDSMIAALALGSLTVINCFGVRTGGTVQSLLMVLKILAIVALVSCGLFLIMSPTITSAPEVTSIGGGIGGFGFVFSPSHFLTIIGAAMVPVLFSYGGWQTSSFVAGEIREPRKNLPRALIIGVTGVIVLYLAVNFVCVYVLGASNLANTKTPASDVMRLALGPAGAGAIAAGIAISTLGFLSQGMLTAPRVYYAMAEDGLFFKSVGKLHPKTHVPILAIVLQGLLAIAITLWGKYEQILNYVVSVDFIFFGATALCVFVFRRRGKAKNAEAADTGLRITTIPGHPVTTALFVMICWLVVINTIYRYPGNTLIGIVILLAGIPAFFFWRGRNTT
ncbi:MAG TPA: amino acid permease [Pyrinomonadaceae bacterium]|nr:amino acid permease [Pyrinomonadaceae bacterium]